MEKNFSKETRKNTLSYYSFFTINSLIAVFLSPLLLNALGSHDFGIWKTCQKLYDFLTAADGRSSQALKALIARNSNSENYNFKKRLVGAALKVWAYFTPIFFSLLILLTIYIPNIISGVVEGDVKNIQMVGIFLSLNVVLISLMGIPDAVLIGSNKGRFSINIQTASLVISSVVIAYAAVNGFTIIGLSWITATFSLINLILILLFAAKKIEWWGISKPVSMEVLTFYKFSNWMFCWGILEKIILSLEIILFSFFINPAAVTIYTFSSYMPTMAIAICLLTGSSMMPALGKVIIDRSQHSKMGKMVEINRQLILLIATICGIYIALFNKSFVNIWIGSDQFIGVFENYLLCLIFIFTALARNEGQMHDLLANIRVKVISSTIISMLGIVAAYIFCNYTEFNDVLIILIFILLTRIPLSKIFSNHFNGVMNIQGFRIGYLFIPLVLISISAVLGYLINIKSWWILCCVMVASSPFIIFLTYKLILNGDAKELIEINIAKRKNA